MEGLRKSTSSIALSLLQAIQNPSDLQLQEKAWNAVCPLVAKLKRFYEFSLRLGKCRPAWCAKGGMTGASPSHTDTPLSPCAACLSERTFVGRDHHLFLGLFILTLLLYCPSIILYWDPGNLREGSYYCAQVSSGAKGTKELFEGGAFLDMMVPGF